MLEKEIEDAFCEYIASEGGRILKRQLALPFGRADVVGYMTDNRLFPFIAEIKRGDVDDRTIVQLLSYSSQVEAMLEEMTWINSGNFPSNSEFVKIVVGQDIVGKAKVLVESMASGLRFYQYSCDGGKIVFRNQWLDALWQDRITATSNSGETDEIIQGIEAAFSEYALHAGIVEHDKLGGWRGQDGFRTTQIWPMEKTK